MIRNYFGAVNFRMIAFPSSALDFYNDFFSTHDLTLFCQISFLKPLVDCPYSDPLSIVMADGLSARAISMPRFLQRRALLRLGRFWRLLRCSHAGCVIAARQTVCPRVCRKYFRARILQFLNIPLTTTKQCGHPSCLVPRRAHCSTQPSQLRLWHYEPRMALAGHYLSRVLHPVPCQPPPTVPVHKPSVARRFIVRL